jgi:hypothetical protein
VSKIVVPDIHQICRDSVDRLMLPREIAQLAQDTKEEHEGHGVGDLRWTDVLGNVTGAAAVAALTSEAFRDTGVLMPFFRHSQADTLSLFFQFPHSWKPDTEVRPHMHVVAMANGSGNAVFDYAYAWSRVNTGQIPAISGWTTGQITRALVPADQYIQKIIALPYVTPPEGTPESAILIVKVGRNPAADTYETGKDHGTAAANIGILSIDAHFQVEKTGTIPEIP